MSAPIEGLLGAPGQPPECRQIADDISVHWYPTAAKAGDLCLCGGRVKAGAAEDGDGS